MSEKLITQPHNQFLLETFRAFHAEMGGRPESLPLAATMTNAHVAHAAAKAQIDTAMALGRIAASLETLTTLYADPVNKSRFDSMLAAQAEKREENRKERAKSAEDAKVRTLFGEDS